jgi:murein DD-endopeptidase MepM/ murein hydrolase activator NlpD
MRTLSSDNVISRRVIRLAGRLSFVALLVGVGACSNFGRSPIFTGSTNQQQIIMGQDTTPPGNPYVGASASVVQGADLPPPSGADAATAYATQEIQQPYALQPSPQPYTPPRAGGNSAPAIQTSPTRLGAPPTTLSQQAARVEHASGRGTVVHTVQSGDTAWNIAHRYGISVNQLAAANGGSTTVRLGTQIAIPGAAGAQQAPVQLASLDPQAGAVSSMPPPAPAVPPAVAGQTAASPLADARAQQQIAVAPQTGAAGAMAPAAPEPTAAATSGFRWPVRGRIISGFGKKPNGERNDGINLAVPEGTAVKAAEDGTVIYAGNELKSYGNLVLIRHSGGWVSAYAHNGELKAKRGDEVRRGQVIALSGMSGGVTTPQVHFELRKDAAPVDPLQHLSET